MGCGKNDTSLPYLGYFLDVGPAGGATVAIAPGLTSGIEPASVRQNADASAMRPPAALANAAGTLKPHVSTELRPIDRIEPAHLSPDRHHRLRSPLRKLVCRDPFDIDNGQSQV